VIEAFWRAYRAVLARLFGEKVACRWLWHEYVPLPGPNEPGGYCRHCLRRFFTHEGLVEAAREEFHR
jgi:hypothetical protein